jgi:hypothetical protein
MKHNDTRDSLHMLDYVRNKMPKAEEGPGWGPKQDGCDGRGLR